MLLRLGLHLPEAADAVDDAIALAIAEGARTRDMARPGEPVLGTSAMGGRVADLVGSVARV
jgi:3-isopropylmalate dehydrogenase